MSDQKHIIGKQIVELQVAPGSDVFTLQQEVSFVFRNEVLPRLESLFDRLVGPDTVIRLEHLEIDLGKIDPTRISGSLVEQILPKLEQELREQIVRLTNTNPPPGHGSFRVSQSLTESLIYFLENGFLPWWENRENRSEWEKYVRDNLNQNPESLKKILVLLKKNPLARERLLLQFGPEILAVFLKEGNYSFPETLTQNENAWVELVRLAGKNRRWDAAAIRAVFHLTVWEIILNGNMSDAPDRVFCHRFISIFSQKFRISYPDFLKQLLEFILEGKPSHHFDETYLRPILLNLWENWKKQTGQKTFSSSRSANPTEEQTEILPSLKAKDKNKDPFVPWEKPEKFSQDLPESGTEIFIGNAGLVLLHPFLPHLFQALKLTEQGKFSDENNRHRAIFLIQYLASGKTETPEHELSLNKILCGLPLSVPVEKNLSLTEAETEESEELLQAVLGHWKALKNTGPDGLRYNFLLREGKLTLTSNGWRLVVEQKTQDILLGKLPWGISKIKLSWMPDMLGVDWA
ncbi:MAG: contractile injection system tape measure protein [Bacteroidia bacterium]|nr:contractile injection system tape measure protein [Bacteroidia bacterium]